MYVIGAIVGAALALAWADWMLHAYRLTWAELRRKPHPQPSRVAQWITDQLIRAFHAGDKAPDVSTGEDDQTQGTRVR